MRKAQEEFASLLGRISSKRKINESDLPEKAPVTPQITPSSGATRKKKVGRIPNAPKKQNAKMVIRGVPSELHINDNKMELEQDHSSKIIKIIRINAKKAVPAPLLFVTIATADKTKITNLNTLSGLTRKGR